MLDWLQQHKPDRPPRSHRFWAVVLVSALNEELGPMDARYGLDVFWKAFVANRQDTSLGIPARAAGRALRRMRAAIEQRGGEVALQGRGARRASADGRVGGVEMDGGRQGPPISTSSPCRTRPLSDCCPSRRGRTSQCLPIRNLRASPITSVHFWFDRDVMAEPFLTLIDRTTQWIFNKSRL